ncbi:hypothetical protein [Streptosporangium sp. NPDC000396]|uniref:hypothetical protein n=1 Tax=Streptosporangium sp. NPDC000396 TaxID=3366185 RepID=UPI0036B62DA8
MFARSTVVVALSLAVLTACGSEPAPAPRPAAAPTPNKASQAARQVERIKADCMKQKGFTYTPFVQPPEKESETERRAEQGDYAAMKEFRAKYGFRVFAAHVYPNDPASGAFVREAIAPDPNDRYRTALNDTQLEAYQEAEDACFAKGMQKVLHKKVSSLFELVTQLHERSEQIEERELDGDPRLVELAVSFGDCLKAKGYPVTSLKPTAMEDRGQEAFRDERKAMKEKFGPSENSNLPNLKPDQARPYLVKEIKAALDDLECGKDFYAVYAPKKQEIRLRVRAEFGETI